MKEPSFVAVVPLKLQSRRLPNKNFLNLAGKPLVCHILETLKKLEGLNRICVYASNSIFKNILPEGVEFVRRPAWLDGDEVTGSELYYQAAKDLEEDYILLTHATNPLIRAETLQRAIDLVRHEGAETVVAVQRAQKFAWFKGRPLNYDPSVIERTQDLEPVELETSSFYVFPRSLMLSRRRRVGDNPVFLPVGLDEQVDIDTEEDFAFAERLLASSNWKGVTTLPRPHELALIELVPTRDDVKLVAFDLDGVLLESKENMRYAWTSTAQEFGLDVGFEEYFSKIGQPFPEILAALGISERHAEIEAAFCAKSLQALDRVTLVEGVVEALERIKSVGMQTAIVTSKDAIRTEMMVKSIREYIDHIVCPTAGLRGKPAPDQILQACLLGNVDPGNVLYVGDMAVDHVAARRAGTAYAHAAWGYGDPVDGQAVWFAEIRDLAAFLVDK